MRVPFVRYVQGHNSYIDGDRLKYGIAVHNTSNDASDEQEASYAARRTDGVSAHFFADLDSVTQSIDTAAKAGHAGSREGNENGISWEFTGANGKTRDWWLANICWDLVGRVNAAIIRHHWPDRSFQVRRASVAEMKANPKVKAFYGHDDMRRAWGGTTHTDPGPNFPWDKLFAVTNAALADTPTQEEEDMFCRYGDKGPKVEALQRLVVAAGGSVGVKNGQPDFDGNYGDGTAKGLIDLVGSSDGKLYGPAQYAVLQVRLAQKYAGKDGMPGRDGAPGAPGPQGMPGKTPTKVSITGTGQVIETV